MFQCKLSYARNEPGARIYCTAISYPDDYLCVLEKLKRENALDLGSLFSFHPYWPMPESGCRAKTGPTGKNLRALVKRYSPDFDAMMGEAGCPAQLEFAHALHSIEWTELSQAKWNLRLQMGAAVREMPSSLFTFIDLQYTFMLQSFGLIRSNALKEPVYRRPSYYAMRNFYAVFDDDVSVRGFEKRRVGGKELSVAKFSRQGKPFAAVWLSGERPGDSLAYAAVDLSMLVGDRPTEWIDLLTGRVYELRDIGVTPVWDSPVLLAGDGVIPLE